VVVVTGVGMGNSVLNNIQDVRSWIRRTIVCDFVIRVMMPSMTGAEAAELPENVLPDVRAVPGVTSVETIAFATAESEGRPLVLVIRSFPRDAPFSLDLRDLHGLTPEEVHQRLLAGEVVLSTVLAQRMGKAPGDELTLSTKNGTQRVRIAATNTDYIVGGSVVYISSDTAAKLLGVRRVQGLLIRIDPQRRAAVETRLAEIARQSGALLHSMTDVTNVVENLMSGIVAAMWALLASGFVVAAFGVINTLTMNVLEQTRELGLLRVVAMTRYQVRNYIFAQAAVIGIVGLLPGAVVGEVIAYIINLVTYPLLGHPIDFAFRPEVIATCLAVAFLITIASAYLPSERAARLGINEAIQSE